jgi:pimeloyl-ACP methyl ester carboxylesterase
VLDWGGSGQPIVLLGCYLTAHMYDEFAPKLTNQFHVYGITRRGIGASDKPASGYTVQRSADDVLEVLDSLKLRKSLLVGTSCAGQILTLFASQHSDRLNGLVYLDGATDPTLTPTEYIRRCQIPQRCRDRSSHVPPITARSRRIESRSDAITGSPFPRLNCVNSSSRMPTARWADRSCRP